MSKLNRELRSLASWVETSTRARDQAPIWRFNHLLTALLSLLLLTALELGRDGTPAMVLAGWAMLLMTLLMDFHTLRAGAEQRGLYIARRGYNA